jgi:hypothetical protein
MRINGQQPCEKMLPRPVGAKLSKGSQESLVGRVLSLLRVPWHPIGKVVHVGLVLLYQVGEGSRIALLGPLYPGVVVHFQAWSLHWYLRSSVLRGYSS